MTIAHRRVVHVEELDGARCNPAPADEILEGPDAGAFGHLGHDPPPWKKAHYIIACHFWPASRRSLGGG